MSRNTRTIAADPDRVWQVLSDGWLYPSWVVGATRMRQVDDEWPAVGSALHHSIGVWPLLIDDTTEVLEALPGRLLKLRAGGRPIVEAQVDIQLDASGAGTLVTIEEDAISGPGRLVPKRLRDVALAWRNVETLRRLAYLAEGGAALD